MSAKKVLIRRFTLMAALAVLAAVALAYLPATASGVEPHGHYTATSSLCANCHRIHGAPGPTLFALGTESTVCFTCHDGTGALVDVQSEFALAGSGHLLEDEGNGPGAALTSRCSSCHAPHMTRAGSPRLHRTDINGATVTGSNVTWCQACHNDAFDWTSAAYPYPRGGVDPTRPERASDGYPVSGTFPGATTYNDPVGNAHNAGTSTNVIWPGSGQTSGDCRNCHASHRSASPRDSLRAQFRPTPDGAAVVGDRTTGAYAELCLTCHDADGPATTDIKTTVTYQGSLGGVDITGGHRIRTAGGTLPVGAPLPCYDCHNPHGSAGNNGTEPNQHLVSDERWSNIDTSTTAGVVNFCFQCHLPWEYAAGSGQPEQNTVPPGQAIEIEGLDRRDPVNSLSLPPNTSAHGKGNLAAPSLSCYFCHGNDYGAPLADAGYNVHRPNADPYDSATHTATPGSGSILIFAAGEHDSAMEGEGAVVVGCATCHNTRLGPLHDMKCDTCHPAPYDTLAPSWTRGCQQGGCHAAYHTDRTAHWSVEEECTTCHDTSWNVTAASCPNCHATYSAGDITPPVTTSDALASYVGAARINFSITDGGKVGVGITYYRLDGGALSTGDSALITTSGAHSIEFWSVDQNGNVESPHKFADFTILPDTTAPVTTSNAQANYYSTTAYITLSATDASSLGVKTTYYELDGGPTQTGTLVSVPPPSSGAATHTLVFWSDDYSGNVESKKTATFTITVGTGTIRLVWGDSDMSGPPGPGSEATWVIRRGGWSGTIVASGSGSYPGWDGVDDYVFPLNPTLSYFVIVDWWDDYYGYWDQSAFGNIVITADGQLVRLSY